MLGIRAKRVAIKPRRRRYAGRLEALLDRRVGIDVLRLAAAIADLDAARGEVDVELGGIVDTAEVAHEHIVDKDPDVVIAREGIRHVLAGDFAVLRLQETRGHREAKVMIERAVGIAPDILLGERAAAGIQHLIRAREREELPVHIARGTAFLNSPSVIDIERIVAGIVGGVVLLAVVDVIAVVDLEQTGYIVMPALASRVRVVEQVVERLAVALVGRRRDLRVAVDELPVHEVVGLGAARPLVDA